MKEIWKSIYWYENYEISSMWRVRSMRFWNRIIHWFKNNRWYIQYIIRNLKWIKKILAHRLVWQAFLWLDISNSDLFVCHKDDNPSNNCVDNLFLGTAKDNNLDKIKKWRWNSRCIVQTDFDWYIINDSLFIKDLKLDNRFCTNCIKKCCEWKKESHEWFYWKYK